MSRLIVISPHLDDAVFSAWHLLGSNTTVLTVFAGEPPAGTEAWWDKLCGQRDSVAMTKRRKSENEHALKPTKTQLIYLNFLDNQYRSQTVEVSSIVDEILYKTNKDDEYMVNLTGGVWGHKDHILTRQAGIELMNKGRNVNFYLDIPYMGLPKYFLSLYIKFIEKEATRLLGVKANVKIAKLNEQQLRNKIQASLKYGSQYKMTNLTSLGRLSRYINRGYEIEILTKDH